METIVAYKTKDGKVFDNKDTAIYHEERINRINKMNDMLDAGRNLYEILKDSGVNSPDIILKKITKKTKFVIEHWQCKNIPGYKISRFNDDYTLYLWGDVGSWSGPYGSEVSLDSLIRYAKHENTEF